MSFISDFFNDITGRTGEVAARDAAAAQVARGEEAGGVVTQFGEQAQGFLDPFSAVGQQGLSQAGFLGDPQAQFDFLQQNPLFQLALENADRGTTAQAAAGGRLQAGDTLQRLSENVLLSAQPLLDRQRQDIFGQLNFGGNIAGQQAGIAQGTGLTLADILTSIGASEAGGLIGRANARAGGAENILNIAGLIAGGIGGGGGAVNPLATGANAGTGVLSTNLGTNFFGGP